MSSEEKKTLKASLELIEEYATITNDTEQLKMLTSRMTSTFIMAVIGNLITKEEFKAKLSTEELFEILTALSKLAPILIELNSAMQPLSAIVANNATTVKELFTMMANECNQRRVSLN